MPVLATNSGGPTESILHEATGWLLPSDDDDVARGAESNARCGGSAAQAWSAVMASAAADESMCKRMGKTGR